MPAFRVGKPRWRLRCNAAPSIAAGFQTIPWNVTVFDDELGYDGAGGYVPDRDGLWLTGVHVSRNSIAAAFQPQLQLLVDGTVVSSARALNRVEGQGVAINDLIELEAGDVLTVEIAFSATVAVGLNTDAYWWGTRVGPKRWV